MENFFFGFDSFLPQYAHLIKKHKFTSNYHDFILIDESKEKNLIFMVVTLYRHHLNLIEIYQQVASVYTVFTQFQRDSSSNC